MREGAQHSGKRYGSRVSVGCYQGNWRRLIVICGLESLAEEAEMLRGHLG